MLTSKPFKLVIFLNVPLWLLRNSGPSSQCSRPPKYFLFRPVIQVIKIRWPNYSHIAYPTLVSATNKAIIHLTAHT